MMILPKNIINKIAVKCADLIDKYENLNERQVKSLLRKGASIALEETAWVDVKVRMPKDGEYVLISSPGKCRAIIVQYTADFTGFHDVYTKWNYKQVTEWHPLPPLPAPPQSNA